MFEMIYLGMKGTLKAEIEKQNLMTEEITEKFHLWDAAFERKDWDTCITLIDEIGKIAKRA